MRRRTPALGDDVMVRRAARGVAAQVAGLVFAAMLLLVVLVSVVVVRGQSSAADQLLRSTVLTADDVGDPPAGAWLAISDGSQVTTSPGLPEDLLPALDRLRARAGTTLSLTSVSDDDGEDYRVAGRLHQGKAVQVVLDLTSQHQQRDRLLKAMGAATALGLLLAAALGIVVGRRAVRPMAQALALQRAFVADASHELRTPLTLLSTRAQVLERAVRASDVAPQAREDARGVVHDVQRIGEVVDDLLLAADPLRQETYEPIDLGALVAAVAATAGAHAEAAGIVLSLLPVEDDTWVHGSAPALRRGVLSLVDNAIEHTPAGGRVRLSVRRDRINVIVAVSDTGPGVSAQDADKVLRRFHSGGQRAGRAHYGLGLALTHDVANRHGGQLRLVASEQGATFELVLPALR